MKLLLLGLALWLIGVLNEAQQISEETSQQILYSCYRLENTSSSQYERTVDAWLPSLAVNAVTNRSTYANDAVSSGNDRIYGYAQCMSAATHNDCHSCFNLSVPDLRQLRCPNSKKGVICYQNCIIRYSNESFFSILDTSLRVSWSGANVSDPDVLNRQLGQLMRNLALSASSASSRFAAERISYSDFTDLYGMAQCTRDLSSNGCFECLQQAITGLEDCCQGRRGGFVYYASCNIRFATSLFFSADLLAPSPAGSPPPPPKTEASAPSNPPPSTGGSSNTTAIIAIICSVLGLCALVLVFCICLRRRKRKSVWKPVDETEKEELKQSELRWFDFETLKTATNNFGETHKLGHGGFGSVYKGILAGGQEIAIKRLVGSSNQGIRELRNEVTLVAQLQHRNLARLWGCCIEAEEMLLVYEYLPNTSLDKFLFHPTRRAQLNWEQRYKIIEGIARGLLYLHEDSRLRIIHRDLKASNILLDENMNAKISDFGLAKFFGGDETQGNTSRIAGTFGYMAPEYVLKGQFSTKLDVFGFGVLTLELVTGQQNAGYNGSEGVDLLSYVWKHWVDGSALDLVDAALGENRRSSQIATCIHLGLLCVQEDPIKRPAMSTIVLMLTSQSTTLPGPSPPAFVMHRTSLNSNHDSLQSLRSSQATISTNDASITSLLPR